MARQKRTNERAKSKRSAAARKIYDVIVVGAGPAGSVLAWNLASAGVSVLLLEASRFPREKVCGDYVEPRGLRILQEMGVLAHIEKERPLPVTHSAIYINSECRYRRQIPFYGLSKTLPPHGYVVPREKLDEMIFRAAVGAGATAHEQTMVREVNSGAAVVTVEAKQNRSIKTFRGRLVVGADGVNSVVARSVGLLADDNRHIALSQRAYAEGIDGEVGESAVYFEKDLFPGYGWMFPIRGGRVNFGVGVLAESVKREGVKVPQLFTHFFETLRRSHHRCQNLKMCGPPIGGIVKTYGGAGPNYFDGGLLIGDAGSFVDPMTGEGITPAIESALIAAKVIKKALAKGRTDAAFLAQYESEFRAHFDPSMVFVDLCAAVMRNTHFADAWLRALEKACEVAQRDLNYAQTGWACFGGLEIKPPHVLSELWQKTTLELMNMVPASLMSFAEQGAGGLISPVTDWFRWPAAWWSSVSSDPFWHAEWQLDLQSKWLRALSLMAKHNGDPRAIGLV